MDTSKTMNLQIEPIIHFRDLSPSPTIEALIRKRSAALSRFGPISGCEVVAELPGRPMHHGREVRVGVRVSVPGPDLSVARSIARGTLQQDLRLAVNRAFDAVEEQLKRRGDRVDTAALKPHPPHLHGRITQLEPELGYGYVTADDGREVYVQRDGLVSDEWGQLKLGTRLRFREMAGEKGPYAIAVSIAD